MILFEIKRVYFCGKFNIGKIFVRYLKRKLRRYIIGI